MEFIITDIESSNTENNDEQEIKNNVIENLRSQYSEIQNIVIENEDVKQNLDSSEFEVEEIIDIGQNLELENLTTTKLNTYICGICDTHPLLLKEHKRHLQSIKHRNNRNNCKILITPYISNLVPKNDEWKKLKRRYFINENYDYNDLYLLKICQQEKNRSLNLDDDNDKQEYFDWKINRIIQDIEIIQENKKDYENENKKDYENENHIKKNKNLSNYHQDNLNLDEINFILNNICLNQIKNLLTSKKICLCRNLNCKLCSEKNEDLIFKQNELFKINLNLLIDIYGSHNLNEEMSKKKYMIKRANFNLSILAEVLYMLFKNNLSYDILKVNNTLRTSYDHINISNFSNDEFKFIWIYKNEKEEFFIIDENKLMTKFEIILLSLSSKIGLSQDYNYYNYLKNFSNFNSKQIFDILKALFLLNNII